MVDGLWRVDVQFLFAGDAQGWVLKTTVLLPLPSVPETYAGQTAKLL